MIQNRALQDVPPAVLRYLEELEIHLKAQIGVSPEEAISDAREFLLSDSSALHRSGESPDVHDHYLHIVQSFGLPETVAKQYASSAEPGPTSEQGYAPQWRICCTRCGRSKPLAATGAIRICSRSYHKYTLGFCYQCKRLRWCRLIRDLDQTNLTRQLGIDLAPDALRQSMHVRPFKLVGLILLAIFLINAVVGLFLLSVSGQFIGASPLTEVQPIAETQVHQLDSPIQRAAFLQAADDSAKYKNAIETLVDLIQNHYSYRDLKGIDWRKRINESSEALENSKSDREFVANVVEVLKPAEDVHVWLELNGKNVPTYQITRRNPNFNARVLPRVLTSLKQHGTTVVTGFANDKIHYVAIATWDHREPDAFAAAKEAVRNAVAEKAPLIIDVRPNSGGDERQARQIAGFFTQATVPYQTVKPWQQGKAGEIYTKQLMPSEERLFHTAPCVVLMGSENMSSCEAFLQMMRACGVTLIGQTSRGTSGNPQPHELCAGVRLYLPSWQVVNGAGEVTEGKGITPDISVETKSSDFRNADPVLAKAIEVIQSRKK